MSWFKVDDGFASSRKVLGIPKRQRLAAVGLWTLAGSWCAKELTDGRVPDYMIEELGGTQASAEALVTATLWSRDGHAYVFSNWSEYQPSSDSVRDARDAARRRQAEWRAKRAGVTQKSQGDDGVTNGVTPPLVTDVSHDPDPTRPDPTVKNGGAASRGTRIPEPFEVTVAMAAWAREHAPLVDGRRSTERFENYWRAKTGKDATKLDWERTWHNWLLKDQEDAEKRAPARMSPEDRARATLSLASTPPRAVGA